LYPLLAAGKLDYVVADAEDVVLLRSENAKAAPFKYVMALYQNVPNALFSKAEKNIKTINDLKGKTIGIPGKYGNSWTSLQATLKAAKLKETDVKILEIGFTQLEAVVANRVDVAMGFINNEPVKAARRWHDHHRRQPRETRVGQSVLGGEPSGNGHNHQHAQSRV
jgi:NitT/TauT family transport system substrate-binding protein